MKTRFDYLGLSSEEKPTEKAVNGSTFLEVDTSKFYIFYNGEWFYKLHKNQPTIEEEGQNITIDNTIKYKFIQPPLPRGNSEQTQYSGRNFLPKREKLTFSNNGVTVTSNGDGSYKISGTPTASFSITISIPEVNVPANSYIHLRNKGTLSGNIACSFRYNNNNVKAPSMMTENSIALLSENSSIINQMTFLSNSSAVGTPIDITCQPSIELTNEATSYEPYVGGTASPNPNYPQPITNVTGDVEVVVSNSDNTESQTYPLTLGNIELCKIGNYQDYIYNNNGTWYKHSEIGKIILDGSQAFNYYSPVECFAPTTNLLSDAKYTGLANSLPICNYLIGVTNNWSTTGTDNSLCIYADGTSNPRIKIKSITNKGDFMTWLTTNKPIIYYVLATPTDTEITDTTLINELEDILNATSYNEQTNITGTSDEANPIFNVEAYQSLN